MAGPDEQEARLAAMEVLLMQMFVGTFRGAPAEAADAALASWEDAAEQVLAENADAAHFAREFYAEVRAAVNVESE